MTRSLPARVIREWKLPDRITLSGAIRQWPYIRK